MTATVELRQAVAGWLTLEGEVDFDTPGFVGVRGRGKRLKDGDSWRTEWLDLGLKLWVPAADVAWVKAGDGDGSGDG